MKPVIDLEKEYGLVLEGGGAKGAYQIGAWRALKEAGVKIKGVAGTSVGALNGALICMDDYENAKKVWENITYSKIMSVKDEQMQKLFREKKADITMLKDAFNLMKEGGIDVTPLRELIAECIDEEKILNSPIDLYVLTFDVDEWKELDINMKECEDPSMIKDFLLASAYIFPLFKNEKLHGKTYIDGGAINNVPLGSLVERGYKDIIMIRIFGVGREKKVKIPEDTNIYTVAPKVSLGSIIEFDSRKTRTHLKLGYYDTLRMIYGLKGKIYYIDESEEECYYLNQLVKLNAENYRHIMTAYKLSQAESRYCRNMTEVVLPVMAEELKLSKDWTYKELYLAVLEATAKLCRISKYKVYTVDELREKIQEKLHGLSGRELPAFVWIVAKEIPEEIPEEISSTDE